MHTYLVALVLYLLEFAHFLLNVFVDKQFIETSWHKILVAKVGICSVQIDKGWIEYLQQCTAQSWHDRDGTSVEDQDQECIIVSPYHVIYLQIGLTSLVEGWTVLRRDKVIYLHRCCKVSSHVDKHYLAVDHVHTVHSKSKHIPSVVIFGYDVSVTLFI